MKKLIYAVALISLTAFAAEQKSASSEVTKTGFLTTEACMQKGEFVDCSLETIQTSPFVIYVHDENVAYKLDINDVLQYPLYEDIGKNGAKVVGTVGADKVIKVQSYTPAPPETKSFFKGCM